MIVTFEDGTVARGGAAIKAHCEAGGYEWPYWRDRSLKGLGRAAQKRAVRLPDDWRARLDGIFGPEAVVGFSKEIPARRPAIVVGPNALDAGWARALGGACAILFIVRGRVGYVDVATGVQMARNPKGTVMWLFAADQADMRRFTKALRPFGSFLTPAYKSPRESQGATPS
jgi:hypothetical protein